MTHDELVERAARWLSARCVVVLTECGSQCTRLIPDALGWTASGWSICIECKVSVSDFYADRRKPGHRDGHSVGARRYYMTPPGLLRPELVPEPWGLLEVHPKLVRQVRVPLVADSCLRTELILLAAETRRVRDGFRKPDAKIGLR